MKNISIIIIIVFIAIQVDAQTQFISSGRIEFEQKENMYKKVLENENSIWTDQIKKQAPEFRTTYFDLLFDEHQSVYKDGKTVEDPWKKIYGLAATDDDITYNNYDSGRTIATKQVFEKLYKINDSLLNIEWRIEDETRNIAGFDCRKAVGRFYDTLYVVAFYTDQIITPGGPANYTGLPGMILGLAFPRFNTTIFATKLYLEAPKPADLKPSTKGKTTVTRSEMYKEVKPVFTRYGEANWQKEFWTRVL